LAKTPGRTLIRILRIGSILVAIVLLPIVLFLAGSIVGGLIPRDIPLHVLADDTTNEAETGLGPEKSGPVTIYLLSGLLHVDIAIPVGELSAEDFSFLDQTRIPFANPALRFLAFGWGSKAFYTTAGNYSDIRPGAVFTAVTGDDAVMRVTPVGALNEREGVMALTLQRQQFNALLGGILAGFETGADGLPQYLPQYSIGPGDAFFTGVGHFNIFYPCNQWAGDVLAGAGTRTGIWTPTTYSLLMKIAR